MAGKIKYVDHGVFAWPEQKARPVFEITRIKRAEDIARDLDSLPCKQKTLSSNPSTSKK
jgi:hypothetical protein